ncbi:hypothetical protein M438DRAFT_20672 [Aureobasidium pullulans EXF-150]|uniref:Cell wall mannoprotein PIR1-like C-terminal domain-containing protein n=1 Tax=Aureobasidium pullulans EXF-150 TaxID=1043002 RepID=A0A074XJ70_AURPU|nr:uncharacterized protein M438DRAFT_20672 [Aureobasidium pullulans EXF-150]KEQ83724.1 hypothetical protein M438DRAFT_20672 [Aureobasidium pullulans EXF-150]
MKSFAIAAAFAGAAVALPQGVNEAIAPQEATPQGCSTSFNGPFSISIANVTTNAKRDLERRQDKVLTITLANGVLTDDEGRTGYIAANNQFQFDKPAQTGAIYTSGFSVCSNGTLAIGNSAIFYQCLSGDFYNLYDESTGNQCSPIYINVLAAGGSSASAVASASGAATQIGDASTGAPVTQISDGQIQASTGGVPVTQISDGQIQAPTSTAVKVTQISDGQIQAPTTGAPVTQISDGQIQAPTATGVKVTQISDGQIQAPTGGATTRASNGTQVNAATASPIVSYTGAAAIPTFAAEMVIAAGAFAVAFL